MNRFMFGYCATLISALLWPVLPAFPFACAVLVIAVIMLKWSKLLAGSLLAIAWMSLFCHQLLVFTPDKSSELPSVRGEIISLVYRNGDWINADIRILTGHPPHFPDKYLRLRWQSEQKVAIGEVWQFTLAPKPITSVLNQGGFNQQAYQLSKHIIGKGRVIAAKRLSPPQGMRAKLLTQLRQAVATLPNGDLMLALMLGDKQLISDSHWQGLRQSGTGHLVTISGLHLSVLALWVMGLGGLLLGRLTPRMGLGNRQAIALVALLCCGIYAFLAGLGLPTQRALIMLVMVILLGLIRRYASPFERLLWALFIVLLLDPLSILGAGLWLSFGALAIILWFTQALPAPEEGLTPWQRLKWRLGQMWQIQWRLSLSLGLLQGLLFGGFAPYALIFNLIFVPWFSIVVIPLSFMALMIWTISIYLGVPISLPLYLLDLAISPMTLAFDWLGELPLHWLPASMQLVSALVFALLGIILWRLASGAWRWMIPVLLMPLCLWFLPQRLMDPHRWQVHLLDVGQGLSLVVEKQGRALIYDTGAAFGEHFSYAERVIVPFLHYRGIGELDYLVLSHGDNDHSGGADYLLSQYPKLSLVTDLSFPGAIDCRPKKMRWQGLSVDLLGPLVAGAGNNGSCIVRISDGVQSVLIPGDIESEGERLLLAQASKEVQSTVLIAAHHGSNTSSSRAFIQVNQPDIVLYAAGFNNRYGFPKAEVVRRFNETEARQYSTGDNGQLSLTLDRDGVTVAGYRTDLAPFWYNQRFEFGEFGNPE
ncbi:DNA internalization-related competence protein ComEC/Rec2 [Shewanella insulae]|uniref:DNA internalization-related competence protein ComEC/Rec2 n=1 Tax=Shewanella insulae TaxID=2681496 RepID=UPI00247FF5F0|nr:DNA internalization-related competence protein ComEC/Rec2 [Shewanella insulae]